MGEARRKYLWKEGLTVKCEDCEFWKRSENETDGECRRYPPIPLLVPMAQNVLDKSGKQAVGMGIQCFFPKTRGEIFCGEFKIRVQ